MKIRVEWADEYKMLLHYAFDQRWTWDDFDKARVEAKIKMDAVSHPVGIIFEMGEDIKLPPDFIIQAPKHLPTRHPRSVILVVVGASPTIRTMYEVFQRLGLAGDFIKIAETIEEAQQIALERVKDATW